MKLTKEEKKICNRYKKQDSYGYVHCLECPLVIDKKDLLCKANCTKKEWENKDEH